MDKRDQLSVAWINTVLPMNETNWRRVMTNTCPFCGRICVRRVITEEYETETEEISLMYGCGLVLFMELKSGVVTNALKKCRCSQVSKEVSAAHKVIVAIEEEESDKLTEFTSNFRI